MKRSIIIPLLVLSLALNAFLLITNYIKSTYTPSADDLQLLGEMIVKTLQTDEYADIASKETVYSIKPSVDRFNVSNPNNIHLNEIRVSTNKQTYIFTCDDDACENVHNGGWTYSRYSEEEPILPIKEIKN
ncbi:MAG: hypothetical protein ABS882_12490 [Lysinibacillus sp.]